MLWKDKDIRQGGSPQQARCRPGGLSDTNGIGMWHHSLGRGTAAARITNERPITGFASVVSVSHFEELEVLS
jgi:hypothetical protein